MTLFFILAAALVLLALALLLPSVLTVHNRSGDDQLGTNIAIARERRNTLAQALADGAIDDATFAQEKAQLERDLASELEADQQKATGSTGGLPTAMALAIFVPVLSGALYLKLGNPEAVTPDDSPPANTNNTANNSDGNSANPQAAAMADLLPQLEQRLAEQPDDVMGWRLLGRSYLSISEFDKATAALERALELDDSESTTYTQLAEAIAMSRDGLLAGEPVEYLEKALILDENSEPGLWLLAIARAQAGNHDNALTLFGRLRKLANSEDNTGAVASIDDMMNQSRQALGVAPMPPATAETETQEESDIDTSAMTITVTVDLSDEARAASSNDQLVFIYARAMQGPPMPLAASKHTVGELPVTVTLDESMAVMPTMTLSSFPEVAVGARISKSGNAIAESGDWMIETLDVKPADSPSMQLTISEQKP
ncbi:MAG: c-type cytochrome biogenesis protein CcmI [Granulosicoccus sp.]